MAESAIPETMTACQVVEFNQPYKIHRISTPRPESLGPHDILVKVAVASLCHTDEMVQAGFMPVKLPLTASHEGAGTVVAIGSDVDQGEFAPGTRVMCGLHRNRCGACEDCKGPPNQKQYCFAGSALGITTHGNFAEYVVADSRSAVKVPDNVDFRTAAPLACAGSTVWRGVSLPELKPGQWMAIVGSGGGLGHIGVKFAKALGLKVIGIDARDEGIALSRECGADVVVDARKGDEQVVKEVQAATGAQGGADATVNASDADGAATTACKVTRRHGQMIQLAQPQTVNIPFMELVFRDIRIRGSLVASNGESKAMMKIVSEHGITVQTTPFYGLDKIPEMVDYVHSGKLAGRAAVIVDQPQVKLA